MQRRLLLFSATFAVAIVVVCVSIGVTKNKSIKPLRKITNSKTLPTRKPTPHINSVGTRENFNVSRDNTFASKLRLAIRERELASAKLTRSTTFQQKLQKLKEKVYRKGFVKLIVGIRAESVPEGQIKDEVVLQAQRTIIEKSQHRLLDSLSYEPSSLKQYEGIPYVAITTNSTGLVQLESSPEVLDVSEDIPMKLATDESLTIIGAQKSWAGGYTGSGQTIAILDSGIDKAHPALKNSTGNSKVVSEACYSQLTDINNGFTSLCPNEAKFSTASGSGANCDISLGVGCEHGTQTAGVAAGNGGVAIRANLISIKVATLVSNE